MVAMICYAYICLCGKISIEWTPCFLFHSMQSTIDKYRFTNAEKIRRYDSILHSYLGVMYKISSKILIQREISGTSQPQERVIEPNKKPVMS